MDDTTPTRAGRAFRDRAGNRAEDRAPDNARAEAFPPLRVRLARPDDDAALLEIARRGSRFQYPSELFEAGNGAPSGSDAYGSCPFARLVADPDAAHALLVAEATDRDGKVRPVGFACAVRPWSRAAYAWNAELMVRVLPVPGAETAAALLCRCQTRLLALQGMRRVLVRVPLPVPHPETTRPGETEAEDRDARFMERVLAEVPGFRRVAFYPSALYLEGSAHTAGEAGRPHGDSGRSDAQRAGTECGSAGHGGIRRGGILHGGIRACAEGGTQGPRPAPDGPGGPGDPVGPGGWYDVAWYTLDLDNGEADRDASQESAPEESVSAESVSAEPAPPVPFRRLLADRAETVAEILAREAAAAGRARTGIRSDTRPGTRPDARPEAPQGPSANAPLNAAGLTGRGDCRGLSQDGSKVFSPAASQAASQAAPPVSSPAPSMGPSPLGTREENSGGTREENSAGTRDADHPAQDVTGHHCRASRGTAPIVLRPARPGDDEAIRAIYAHYMATPVTFELTLPDRETFAARMADVRALHAFLVAEERPADGAPRVVGYCYAHAPTANRAGAWNAELSVYVDPSVVGLGVGSRLYRAELDLLARQGVRSATGCVTVPNPGSEALHERFGFTLACRLPRAGFKNGCWHDVAWFWLDLRKARPRSAPWEAEADGGTAGGADGSPGRRGAGGTVRGAERRAVTDTAPSPVRSFASLLEHSSLGKLLGAEEQDGT